MKKLILISLVLTVVFATAQDRVYVPKHLKNTSIKYDRYLKGEQFTGDLNGPIKQGKAITLVDEEEIGDTRYDNQSNASIPKKIFFYDDGTIGATWTRSMDEVSFFADRGTGYNYFDGVEWNEWPSERVEDIKVHRPAYAPWGENGELIVSHTSGQGLYLATRPEKGTGDWDFNTLSGPPGDDYILWARVVTSGIDRNRIHILSLTLPESHGGTPYEGLNGALLYSLSTDGGESWLIENEILDGMTSDEYTGFAGDTYAFAEPAGEVVAFVVGDPWTGLFLMKSTDGGESFEKTNIWEHPYPDWELGTPADTFYCADGSQSLAIDSEGKVHVAFGISRVEADDQGTYWYPWEDGIAYWNEDLPAFSNNLHALNPYDHPDSELVEDATLIGWSQDVNGNGELDFMDDLGLYFIGLSSMPQLIIDEDDYIYLVYSSVTEGYSNGLKNYRHIWYRGFHGTWWGDFTQLTEDLIHIFDECVYPSVSANSDNYLHIIYQADTEPGTAVWAAQHDYVDNRISYIMHEKWPDVGVFENRQDQQGIHMSQNFPNPFNQSSTIEVELHRQMDLQLKVSTITGQIVHESSHVNITPGKHHITINGNAFSKGIYFYTISNGSSSVTKKMMVD